MEDEEKKRYNVYFPIDDEAPCILVDVSKSETFTDLLDLLQSPKGSKMIDFRIYKCGQLPVVGVEELYKITIDWLQRVDPKAQMQHPWKIQSLCEPIKGVVDIVIATESMMSKSRKRESSEGLDVVSRNKKARREAESARAPSSAAKPSEMYKEQSAHPIYIGRPVGFRGAPVAIYNEALAMLKDDLNNLAGVDITPDDIAVAHQLIEPSAAYYKDEKHRTEAIINSWIAALGLTIEQTVVDDTAVGGAKYKIIPGVEALLSCVEIKNEIESGGDPGFQAACTWRKWVNNSNLRISNKSCSPCVVLAIAGASFCISGAVFADIPIVERFTDYIVLDGAYNFYTEKVGILARILKATSNALGRLKDHYASMRDNDIEVDEQAYLPKPVTIDGAAPPQLEYIDRLHKGDTTRPFFLAKMEDKKVVVKFAVRYCGEAHRILAEAGLAPTLHFCGRIYGGLHMVVMDYIEDAFTDEYPGNELPQDAFNDIERAIGLLHANGLVFGDLRRPNIILARRENQTSGAYLIDFDWCGKASEARYPDTLNDTGDIAWAEGVVRGGVMEKDHDLFRLQKHKPES